MGEPARGASELPLRGACARTHSPGTPSGTRATLGLASARPRRRAALRGAHTPLPSAPQPHGACQTRSRRPVPNVPSPLPRAALRNGRPATAAGLGARKATPRPRARTSRCTPHAARPAASTPSEQRSRAQGGYAGTRWPVSGRQQPFARCLPSPHPHDPTTTHPGPIPCSHAPPPLARLQGVLQLRRRAGHGQRQD